MAWWALAESSLPDSPESTGLTFIIQLKKQHLPPKRVLDSGFSPSCLATWPPRGNILRGNLVLDRSGREAFLQGSAHPAKTSTGTGG